MSTIHINLVDDWDDFQAVVNSHIEVGNRLGLHTLGSIHYQQSALTGRNRARHLVGEVHMSRSVNQIKSIFLAILHVIHLDSMALDGDTSLALQVHIIEHLGLHILAGDSIGDLE